MDDGKDWRKVKFRTREVMRAKDSYEDIGFDCIIPSSSSATHFFVFINTSKQKQSAPRVRHEIMQSRPAGTHVPY